MYKLSIIFNHCTIMIVMSFWCSFRLLSIAKKTKQKNYKKKPCILYIICSTKSVVEFVCYLTDVLSLYFHLSLDLISKIWVGWEWFRKIQNSFPFVSALILTTMVLGIKKKTCRGCIRITSTLYMYRSHYCWSTTADKNGCKYLMFPLMSYIVIATEKILNLD